MYLYGDDPSMEPSYRTTAPITSVSAEPRGFFSSLVTGITDFAQKITPLTRAGADIYKAVASSTQKPSPPSYQGQLYNPQSFIPGPMGVEPPWYTNPVYLGALGLGAVGLFLVMRR